MATAAQCADWESRIRIMCQRLDWPAPESVARLHAGGAVLAFTAPTDQLLCATEVGEWAWQSLRLAAATDAQASDLPPSSDLPPLPPLPQAPGHPSAFDSGLALQTLSRLASAEARPRALALREAARQHELACLVDDDLLSIGEGAGSRSWPIDDLPAEGAVAWQQLHAIPVALVTGSNGKTTTVRLVSAMLRASGRRTGFNCTDGVFVDGEAIERGDWSGPAGARRVLRDARTQAAVLETARGGILRRGLAVTRADAAIVTNISADHFGEYGIDGLDALADAKLVLVRALQGGGTLVLNAEDAVLVEASKRLRVHMAWFATDAGHPMLREARRLGLPSCAPEDGELLLHIDDTRHRLGRVNSMPLTLDGAARYNIANIAGATLLATLMGVQPATIAALLSRFGSGRADNPGRLERWRVGGAEVLLDYAHNPDGLGGLLRVARGIGAADARLFLLLGQAGNRDNIALGELAAVAAAANPFRVVLKDIAGYMRGRGAGDVSNVLSAGLQASGVAVESISVHLDEFEAARLLVESAGEGDIVVLPVHNLDARERLAAWLDAQ